MKKTLPGYWLNFTLTFGLLIVLLSSSCTSREGTHETGTTPRPTNDFIIVPGQRVGPLAASAARENDLIQTFGAENIKKQPIYIAEGYEMPGYIIFPDTPSELEVVYDTTVAMDKPAFIRISRADTQWKTDQGITLGTTMAELQAINGKPFLFYGFGWDYGGAVTNWNDGAISSDLMITLDAGEGEFPDTLLGDQEISSDNPLLKDLPIRVVIMEVRL
ncbi:MAG: hypothetical protein H6555_11575 [Lewinellaceae bacterium]|nr:hypothetical protein [Lewinellaceae bacterium]